MHVWVCWLAFQHLDGATVRRSIYLVLTCCCGRQSFLNIYQATNVVVSFYKPNQDKTKTNRTTMSCAHIDIQHLGPLVVWLHFGLTTATEHPIIAFLFIFSSKHESLHIPFCFLVQVWASEDICVIFSPLWMSHSDKTLWGQTCHCQLVFSSAIWVHVPFDTQRVCESGHGRVSSHVHISSFLISHGF